MASLLARSLLTACATVLASCVSERIAFPGEPIRPDEQIVAHVEGSAGGFMLFQFLPLGHNARFKRALADAHEQAPAGSRLVNVQGWESWFWAWIGNGYTFHVSADCALAIDPARRPKVEEAPAPKVDDTSRNKPDLLRRFR